MGAFLKTQNYNSLTHDSTLAFVGIVPEGDIPHTIPNGYSTLANKTLEAARFPGHTVGHNGDSLFVWNFANQTWGDEWDKVSEYGGWVNVTPRTPVTRMGRSCNRGRRCIT